MNRLYEVTEGRTLNVVSIDQLAIELGWSDTEASAVVEYLNAEGLTERHMGNQASTHTTASWRWKRCSSIRHAPPSTSRQSTW